MKHKMNRVISLVLILMLSLSSVPATVFAEEDSLLSVQETALPAEVDASLLIDEPVEEADVTDEQTASAENDEEVSLFATSGTCGTNLTWTLDNAGTLTISGTGAMTDWYLPNDAAPWYDNRLNIKNINIESGVTSIGEYAFAYCDSLTTVTIPDDVTTIGQCAFFSCANLTAVTIGNGTTTIGMSAFNSCESLATVIFGNSVTEIGSSAFKSCDGLTTVTIPDSVATIGDSAFNDCSNLVEATMGDGVTTIGSSAFKSCASLTEVTIGSSVTTIGNGAFYSCRNLSDVYYNGTEAQWKNISIGSNNTYLNNATMHFPTVVANGTCGESLTWTLDDAGTLTISGTGAMDDWTYSNNVPWYSNRSNIKKVVINNGVTTINDYAFDCCNSLTTVTIADSVTTIGAYAFYSCGSLTNVTMGNSVTTIECFAFSYCDSLTNVNMGNGVTTIGDYAFYGCNSLTTVNIPDNVTTIGEKAFYYCDSLTDVTIPDSVTTIGAYAFYNCGSLTAVTIGNSVTTIGEKAFYYCDSLTDVTIPDSVTTIGAYAFYNCDSLTTVNIPDSVTTIGSGAFDFCDSLTTVTIPDSVTTIGGRAFSYCDSLTSITVDDGNPNYASLDGNLFNKSKTTLIQYAIGKTAIGYTIPSTVTTIGDSAFSDCDSLTTVTIPDSVATIGILAFSSCDSLTSVTIGNSVTTIGDSAFEYCDSLTDVYYDGTAAEWDEVSIGESNEPLLNATIHFQSESENGNSCGTNLTWTLDDAGTLTISGNGAMTGWSSASNVPWYSKLSNIKKVIIESGVTTIGRSAFELCSSLTTVTIADSVTTIGASAFYNCGSLTNVTMGNSVTTIECYAFFYCDSLTTVTIPDSVTAIDNRAFANCTGLTDVYYNGTEAEWNEISIDSSNEPLLNATMHFKTITIASGTCGTNLTWKLDDAGTLTISGTGAMTDYTSFSDVPWYEYRKNIINVIIENGVTTIENSIFYQCTSLTSIFIPESVTEISHALFQDCSSLTNIVVSDNNGYYCTENGILYNKGKTYLICVPAKTSFNDINVPNSVKYIKDYAFSNCNNIENIIIPDSVVTIQSYTFNNCKNLTNIVVSENNSEYSSEDGILYNKDKTEIVRCPENIMLTAIVLPSNITEICPNAFYHCSNIENITIPNKVTYIGLFAFSGCNSLNDVYYNGTEAQWNEISIGSNNQPLLDATKHFKTTIVANGTCGTNLTWTLDDAGTLTISGTGAMADWSTYATVPWAAHNAAIKKVVINNGVTTIGKFAFFGCINLTNVSIAGGLTKINEDAFAYSGLTTLTIPGNVKTIGKRAFYHCDSLTVVNLLQGVTAIGEYAFSECVSLENVNIPASVTTIESKAFAFSKGLTAISVDANNANYTSVDGSLFNKNKTILMQYAIGKNATSYTIPGTVTTIDERAFSRCDGLTSMSIPNTVTTIRTGAFSECNSLKTVTIPKSVTSIGYYAFTRCSALTAITVDGNNPNYTSVNGDLFNKNKTILMQYAIGKTAKSYTVPNGVATIDKGAFNNCKNITEIHFPDSVTQVNEYGFEDCDNLADVYYDGTEAEWNTITIKSNNQPLLDATKHFATPQPSTYTVTYHANGGAEAPAQQTKTHGTAITLSTAKLSRFPYTFLGWSESASATTATYAPGATYTNNANVTLYAVWSSAVNLSTTLPTTATGNIPFGGSYRYFKFTPQVSGTYIFESTLSGGDSYGYLYNAGGTELTKNDDSGDGYNCLISYNLTAGTTYYYAVRFYSSTNTGNIPVKLSKNATEYTVTYDYATNGGSSATKTTAKVNEGERADLTVTAVKSGWEFVGWNTDKNATTALASYPVTGDVTLYAIYKKNLTVSFYAGNKTLQANKTVTLYNLATEGTVTAPTPATYSGWTALGWRSDTNASAAEYGKTATITVSGNKTFYAVYSRSLTLSYNANGGNSTPAAQTATQHYNAYGNKEQKYFTLSGAIAKTGSVFNKWAMGSINGVAYSADSEIMIVENTTMYALWIAQKQYTLTYRAHINGDDYELSQSYPENTTVTLPAYPFELKPEGAVFLYYLQEGSDEKKFPGDTLVMDSNKTLELRFTPLLVTQFSKDTKEISASYAGVNEFITSRRGFKYKKIDASHYTTTTVSTIGEFKQLLNHLEAGYEYEAYAFEVFTVNKKEITVEGVKTRFKIEDKALTLNNPDISLAVNDNFVLVANIEGYDASEIVWYSENTQIAKVNQQGFVTALKKGTTNIVATTVDGKYEAKCKVEVINRRLVSEYDFSEWNLAMKLSSNGQEADKTGSPVELGGANVLLGMAGLASWRGVALEESDVYPTVPNETNYDGNAPVKYHVQNAYILPKRKDANDLTYVSNIKRALVNYGAVYAAFNSFEENWGAGGKNYYNHSYEESMLGAHAITIVGWDDHYNRNNFNNRAKVKPRGDGAFLCKNSYGTEENDQGYFYISYYDQNLCLTDETMVFPGVGSKTNYDNIYEHDAYGPTIPVSQANEIMTANVFKGEYENETLEAVSFYTYDMATNYEIYVVSDYTGTSDFSRLGKCVAKGSFEYAGYHTVKFDESVALTGTKFAAVVKLTKPGYNVNTFIEMPIDTSSDYINGMYSLASASAGESFINKNGVWQDLTASYPNANNCIKAFTKGTEAKLFLFDEEDKVITDDVMTLDEVIASGAEVNPRFLNYLQGDIQLFATGNNGGLAPSPTTFGSYDSRLFANDKYPAKYSLKDMGFVTPVKNQLHNYATCWAHSIYGSLESSMLRLVARTRSEMLNGGVGAGENVSELIVDPAYTSVSGVSLDKTSYQLAIGNTIDLRATVQPTSAQNQNVSYKSSNPSVASVNIYGKVTGLAAGTATITVTTEEGNKTAECVITVTEPVLADYIVLDETVGNSYTKGNKLFLPYTVYPTNAGDQTLTWESSDENIATVNENGLITAVGSGEVTVKAMLNNGSFAVKTLSIDDGNPVHISDLTAKEKTVSNLGSFYTVSFKLDNIVENMKVMVAAYDTYGRLIITEIVDLTNDVLEANFAKTNISYFNVFAWDEDNAPLSATERVFP